MSNRANIYDSIGESNHFLLVAMLVDHVSVIITNIFDAQCALPHKRRRQRAGLCLATDPRRVPCPAPAAPPTFSPEPGTLVWFPTERHNLNRNVALERSPSFWGGRLTLWGA